MRKEDFRKSISNKWNTTFKECRDTISVKKPNINELTLFHENHFAEYIKRATTFFLITLSNSIEN
jgi:hypothetical protein